MPSFQTSLTPSKRAAGRFVGYVRRALQKALADEAVKTGLTQAEIARRIGVHRSVINKELQGRADITLGRVGELAHALGRVARFELEEVHSPSVQIATANTSNVVRLPTPFSSTSASAAA